MSDDNIRYTILANGQLTPSLVEWPNSINEAGMYGIAGEFVHLAEPETEADPNILLLTFLAYAGNLLGRQYFVTAGSDRHCGNLYLCIVGGTGSGRKGSAVSAVENFFQRGEFAPAQGQGHYLQGISTGEGLIWEIHDQITKRERIKNSEKFEDVTVEADIPDKRLLIYLSEFQQCISAMRRQDSILSSVFRQAWDKDTLSAPAKNNPAKASGAMVSVVSCITRDELLRQTTEGDAENGTLNRFMFACSRRSKLLPEGGKFFELMQSDKWINLQKRFQQNIQNAIGASIRFERDAKAKEDWGFNDVPGRGIYRPLSQTQAGLFGTIIVRAPQQVMRLSLITAAINGEREIRLEHQDAGHEMWRYSQDSAQYIFGKEGDETANKILEALRLAADDGLTQTQMHKLWGNKKPAEEIAAALTALNRSSLIRLERIKTSGRPIEKWYIL